MAILVDDAIWPWRGQRWAHLVSDESVAELHDFSRKLRVRRLSFSGDHYDVTADARLRALELGALPVDARELVRRLRERGLRRRDVGRWEQVGELSLSDLPVRLSALVPAATASQIERAWPTVLAAEPTSPARIVARKGEVVAVVMTRFESEARLADRFELRVTPDAGLWFTELAAEHSDSEWSEREHSKGVPLA